MHCPFKLAEHAMVRGVRDCVIEGHELSKDTLGAIVAVHANGEAYAVELEDAAGKTTVVTLRSQDVIAATVQ